MMFKKGSFEIGATIYPVAMKVLKQGIPIIWRFFLSLVLNVLLFVKHFFLVQPKVWRCFLEQLQVQHGQLPAEDDDQLGHRLRCVVHACHAPEGVYHAAALGRMSAVIKLSVIYQITFYHSKMAGRRRRYSVCQQSQVSHCPSRRAGRSTVVR